MTDVSSFETSRGRSPSRATQAALAVAFLALGGGVWLAVGSPATGYEGSVYAGTPLAFWASVTLSFAVGLVVALWTRSARQRSLAVLLGGVAAASVAGLPLLRGYHYYGELDSLTHLGWVRDLAGGALGPFDLLYPGVHSAATMVSSVTGVGLPRAVLIVVFAVLLSYLAFVPLTVWLLTTDRRATAIGAFGAFMLLPLNGVVTGVQAHPITQATLFFPVLLALLVRYLAGPSRAATGAMVALGSVAIVLYHPQGAMVVLVVFVALALVQLVARVVTTGPVAGLRPLYAQTLVLAVAFFAWTGQFDALYDQTAVAVDSLLALVTGGTEVGAVVEQRGGSLSAIGSSLFEVFLKLFLVSAVFLGLSAALFAESLLKRVDRLDDDAEGVVRLLGIALGVIAVVTVLHLVGPLSKLVFRYFAMGMVVATVLGSVAIARYVPLGLAVGPRSVSTATVVSVALAAMIALSMMTVHVSPFVHRASPHVTEMHLQGYESTLENDVEGGRVLGVRWPAWRFQHAISGVAGTEWAGEIATPEVLEGDVPRVVEGPTYVAVSALDRFREVRAYEEFRYRAADFDRLTAITGLHRVQSNGEFTVYYAP